MRYHGGGVGHLATRQCNNTLLADKHIYVAESEMLHEPTGDQDEDGDDDGEQDKDGDTAEGGEDGNAAENEGDEDEDGADDDSEGEGHADNLFSGDIGDADIVNLAGFAAL